MQMTEMCMLVSNSRFQLYQFCEEYIKLETLENIKDFSQHESYTNFFHRMNNEEQ